MAEWFFQLFLLLSEINRMDLIDDVHMKMSKAVLAVVGLFAVFVIFLLAFQLKKATDVTIFRDAVHHISFAYPKHWETRDSNSSKLFAANFDYLDGLAASSTSTEVEGTLVYAIVENPGELPMKDYYEARYEECINESKNSQLELGPFCDNYDFSESQELTINGYTAYLFDWRGVAESGEQVKQLLVDVTDKHIIVRLTAVRTGITDEPSIEMTFQRAVDSLKIE